MPNGTHTYTQREGVEKIFTPSGLIHTKRTCYVEKYFLFVRAVNHWSPWSVRKISSSDKLLVCFFQMATLSTSFKFVPHCNFALFVLLSSSSKILLLSIASLSQEDCKRHQQKPCFLPLTSRLRKEEKRRRRRRRRRRRERKWFSLLQSNSYNRDGTNFPHNFCFNEWLPYVRTCESCPLEIFSTYGDFPAVNRVRLYSSQRETWLVHPPSKQRGFEGGKKCKHAAQQRKKSLTRRKN